MAYGRVQPYNTHGFSLGKSTRYALALIALLYLASCSGSSGKPDLERLYGRSVGALNQPPVILIHGLGGAKLRAVDSGEEYWPGPVRKLLFNDFADLALDINVRSLQPLPNKLEAYEITDRAAGKDFYGAIIDTLASAGGYQQGEPGRPVPPRQRNYYLYVYDWRQDNVESTKGLDKLIEQICLDYSCWNPGMAR